MASRITKASKTSPHKNSEMFLNKDNKEVPKERYTFPEERQKNVDNLRLI